MDKREEFLKELKVETGDMQDIRVEDNTEKDYENWKKTRNKKIIQNPKWDKVRKQLKGEER